MACLQHPRVETRHFLYEMCLYLLALTSLHTLTVASATVKGVLCDLCIIKCVTASDIIMFAASGFIMFGINGDDTVMLMFSQQRSQVHVVDDGCCCCCCCWVLKEDDDGFISEGSGVVKFNSNDDVDDDDDDGGGDAGLNANVSSRNGGGGGGGDIGVVAVGAAAVVSAAVAAVAVAVGAANRRFLFSTNRRSFAANGGILRLLGVATFSSTSSLS